MDDFTGRCGFSHVWEGLVPRVGKAISTWVVEPQGLCCCLGRKEKTIEIDVVKNNRKT